MRQDHRRMESLLTTLLPSPDQYITILTAAQVRCRNARWRTENGEGNVCRRTSLGSPASSSLAYASERGARDEDIPGIAFLIGKKLPKLRGRRLSRAGIIAAKRQCLRSASVHGLLFHNLRHVQQLTSTLEMLCSSEGSFIGIPS